MRALRWVLLVAACLLATAPAASAQVEATTPGSGGFLEPVQLDVTASRSEVSTRLGNDFDFKSEVTNLTSTRLSGLVAHLNIVGLSSGIYVDPEDWSSERTKSVPSLRPGESTEISWSVTAVTGGHAAVYVVVLPRDDPSNLRRPVSSPAIDVRIADTKDLNSGGVLPLALGVPALLGLATIAVRRRRSR
jgi:hypothetical protein